tara:strand:- start:209 stop:598 length:390 start_codon:yes stop_codon:yes gene_type:complete
MSFLEPLIAAALGAGITALAVFLKNNKAAQEFLKYGNLIKKAYDIVDPILDKNIHNWNGSQVDQTFELAIEAVSDSDLTKEEIKKIAVHMAQAWLPAAAADKVRLLEASGVPNDQSVVSDEITKTVNKS